MCIRRSCNILVCCNVIEVNVAKFNNSIQYQSGNMTLSSSVHSFLWSPRIKVTMLQDVSPRVLGARGGIEWALCFSICNLVHVISLNWKYGLICRTNIWLRMKVRFVFIQYSGGWGDVKLKTTLRYSLYNSLNSPVAMLEVQSKLCNIMLVVTKVHLMFASSLALTWMRDKRELV